MRTLLLSLLTGILVSGCCSTPPPDAPEGDDSIVTTNDGVVVTNRVSLKRRGKWYRLDLTGPRRGRGLRQ